MRPSPALVVLSLAASSLVASPVLSSLGAQSTPTERAAAAQVLTEIDALQARIAPAPLARRMAERADADRDRVLARVESYWTGGMQGLSDWIGRHPEVGFKEVLAVDTLTKVLRAAGFRVDTGVAGLHTAFVARWDSPAGTNGPTLGLIGEYDALRGTQGDFHGDQHNAQSPVAIAAALALKDYMTEKRVPGRIAIYGTPGEEVDPPAKTIMWRAGVFKGADILVRSHSTTRTTRARAGFGVCCLNINSVKYVFKGRPSHQMSSWNGRNALEAAVMFYTAVDRLRPSFRPEASIQGIIPEGGAAPNVVPDRARVEYYIRYPDEIYLAHIDSMMANAARGAALAMGVEVEIEHVGEYRDGISLGSLEELQFAYARKLGAPKLVDEAERPSGYEESGWVSREIPGVGVRVASSEHANHTYEMTADNFTAMGHTAFLMDAKVEAAVLFDFLTNASFRATVQTEQKTMAALFDRYVAGLREAYAPELKP
ncbi:peptidase dimerization domain protein [Gemmatirosa kalamazoonensis]|uniref:Peptidase dimerization domain protein n=2 Tax=Gemmatirosa kalamazoonensis TaxID=861299 RepID=W0RHP3_9BACT|nr:peptidase dimerization domain protein [Gemmatirosa kalamazoonensis]